MTYLPMVLPPDPRTRAAIHAPTNVNWTESITYPFGNSKYLSVYPDPVFNIPSIDYANIDPSTFHSFFRVWSKVIQATLF